MATIVEEAIRYSLQKGVKPLLWLRTARELTFDPSKLVSGKVDISLLADGQERDSFRIDELTSYPKGGLKVKCLGEGGFVAVISGENK